MNDLLDIFKEKLPARKAEETVYDRIKDLIGADKRRNVDPNASRDYKKLIRAKLAAKHSR